MKFLALIKIHSDTASKTAFWKLWEDKGGKDGQWTLPEGVKLLDGFQLWSKRARARGKAQILKTLDELDELYVTNQILRGLYCRLRFEYVKRLSKIEIIAMCKPRARQL